MLNPDHDLCVPMIFDNTGYPAPSTGLREINDSILTILSTYIGERVHLPTFGSILMSFVFEPLTLATIYQVKAEIRRAVGAWESRARITSIDFSSPTTGTLVINISWTANAGFSGSTNIPVVSGIGM